MLKPLDWYALSRINVQKPQLHKLHQILLYTNVKQAVTAASMPNRKNLLIIFQRASALIQSEMRATTANISEAERERAELTVYLAGLQGQVQSSHAKITQVQSIVSEKRRMLTKLKDKLVRARSAVFTVKEVYFCPVCGRKDFLSREMFSHHILSEHQLAKKPDNQVSAASIEGENRGLKEFIMTLKDKEMQMMSMILKQKESLDSQRLEHAFEMELRKATQTAKQFPAYSQPEYPAIMQTQGLPLNRSSSNLKQTKAYDSPRDELISQSEFISINQKKEPTRGQPSPQKPQYLETSKKTNNELSYDDYYGIFKNLQENFSDEYSLRLVPNQPIKPLRDERTGKIECDIVDANKSITQRLTKQTPDKVNTKSSFFDVKPRPYLNNSNNKIDFKLIESSQIIDEQQKISFLDSGSMEISGLSYSKDSIQPLRETDNLGRYR